MKKIIILAVLLFSCALSISAETAFRPGTVWTNELRYIGEEPFLFFEELLDEIETDGEMVMPMVTYSEKNTEKHLEVYLKTEGDRILWRSPKETEKEWRVMYDFSLSKGEIVVISSPTNLRGFQTEIEIIGSTENPEYPNFPSLTIAETYRYPNYPEDDHTEVCECFWIKGIGSKFGISECNNYLLIGNMRPLLEYVTYKGEIIYKSDYYVAKTREIGENSIYVTSDGSGIIVKGTAEGTPIRAVALDGSQICSCTSSGSENRIRVEAKGIYVVSVGDKSYKIAI